MSYEFDIRKQNLLWMNVDVIKDEKYKSTVFNIFLKRFSSKSQKPKKLKVGVYILCIHFLFFCFEMFSKSS